MASDGALRYGSRGPFLFLHRAAVFGHKSAASNRDAKTVQRVIYEHSCPRNSQASGASQVRILEMRIVALLCLADFG
jgi:hypothetical protein